MGAQTGRTNFEGERAADQSERVGECGGRHPVPQGPVYGRRAGQVHGRF